MVNIRNMGVEKREQSRALKVCFKCFEGAHEAKDFQAKIKYLIQGKQKA